MSSGPIEFLGESEPHETPSGEFGGDDGLIQPEKDQVLKGDVEASGGHRLDGDKRQAVSERAAVAGRVASAPLSSREAVTGEADTPDVLIDPKTGRVLPVDWSQDVTGDGGDLSALKP